MKKLIFSIIFLFLIISSSFAQYQAFNWYVGAETHLNFGKKNNLDNPVPSMEFTGFASTTNCSILSDSSGQVVIYIKNDTIYFPTTGDSIAPLSLYAYSPNQPFVIVGSQQVNGIIEFEIFSLASNLSTGYDLFYTNGTISGTNLTLIDTNKLITGGLSSKMAVFRGAKTFVVTHELMTNKFRVFSDFSNAISVTSIIGSIYGSLVGGTYDDGYFKFSPAGNYLACSSPSQKDLRIYNFDKASGDLSNERILNSKNFNAFEFAAGNESILYASSNNNIFQIQINSTSASISTNFIGTSQNDVTNMQLAPDGKIYVSKSGDSFLGAINNPEMPDSLCFYDDKQINLSNTSNGIIPAFPSNYFYNIPIVTWSPAEILYNTPVNFDLNYSENPDSSYWDFGNGEYIKKTSNSFSQNIKKLGPTTIKYVLFFNNIPENSWDSVVLSKKVVITKPANMHLISPYDTIICDTSNLINIHVNYPDPNRKFIWTSKNGNLDTINTSTNFQLKYPDVYYLEIQDTLGTTLANDSLVIKQYIPYFVKPINDIALVNSIVDFEIQLNQSPEDFTNISILNYFWNFGNGFTNTGIGLNTDSIVYTTTGNYIVSVNIAGEGCSYDLNKEIYISSADTIIPDTHFLTPNEASLCDSTKDNVQINVPYTNYPFKIHWYYYSTELTANYNTNELITNKPGMYYVEIYDASNVFYAIDSAIIHYNLCQNVSVSLADNSIDAANCNETNEMNFVADVQTTGPCPVDISKFYYYWDFGDNTFADGLNLNAISHKYSSPGIYVAQLFLMDEKNCEHIARKTIFIQQQSSDTIYLKAQRKDALGNYIFDFNINGKFNQDFLDKSMFITSTADTAFANVAKTFEINVNFPFDRTILKASDITFFIKFALWGNFNAELTSPDGVTVVVASMSSSKYLMFGFPGEDLYNYMYGKTKTYFFNKNGVEINDLGNGISSNSYFTPDENMKFGDFYFMPHNIYKFYDPNALLGQNINGTWKLTITGNTHYGKIVSWGLRFNPELFRRDLLPDYITCYDSAGNVYETDNLVLKVPDLGGQNNQITCEIHYPNSNCTLKKILMIEFPKIQNVLTPNGDGINDYWMPVSSTSEADIVVIDKVGRVVADFNAIDNPQGWDGTYNGKALPSDSYWYIIKLKNGTILKGVLTIVR